MPHSSHFDIPHPDMDIFINTDKSPALIQAKATGSPLSGFKVKRGAVVPLSVTVLGSQTATGLRMGIKAKGNYEGIYSFLRRLIPALRRNWVPALI